MTLRLRASALEPALILAALMGCARSAPEPTPQNPSPMTDAVRQHGRIAPDTLPGRRLEISGLLARPVQLFVPARVSGPAALLVHFHGSAFVAEHAVAQHTAPYISAVVNLGAGSSVYERAFTDPAVLPALRDSVQARTGLRVEKVVLSGFSAGCGALRAIFRTAELAERVDAALMLDGIHTSYVPEGRRLAEGGRLDTLRIAPILRFAELAAAGRKQLVITHSEIFPGTYASTTETADYLIRALGLRREAVLEWGPQGMQRLGVARRGRLRIESYAGNTAPDHVDHYHALPALLRTLQ